MSRGDKNYDKVVRKVNNGAKSSKKKGHVHKMVEAMINGDTDTAAEELSNYIRLTSREVILGEAKDDDCETCDCKCCKNKEDCDECKCDDDCEGCDCEKAEKADDDDTDDKKDDKKDDKEDKKDDE